MKAPVRPGSSLPAALLLFALGAGAAGSAHASEPGEPENAASRGWLCRLCPEPGGVTGNVDVGAGWVSDSSLKFGDYRGLQERGGFLALDGQSRYRDEAGRFVDVRFSNLGIDSRSLDLRGGDRGSYTVEFAYREIPKYRGFGAETVYRGVGGNELTLPPEWQPARDTAGMEGLQAALRPEALRISRKILDIGLQWQLAPRWSYDLEFQHQRKEGTRPFGAGVFTIQSSHLPAPVDFSTNRLDMGVSRSGETSHWRLGILGSDFDNPYPAVTWSNPFIPVGSTGSLRASLEPDNRFYRVDMAGTWAPVKRLRLTANAAIGRMEQDDPLLPASINPDFSDVPLPRATADARIDVGTLNLGGLLDARLTPRLSLTARLRRDERDNRTPVDLFPLIVTDLVPRDPRPNRPYSFQRDRGSLSLRYRAGSTLRMQAGAEFEDYERSLQSVRKTEETGYWGQLSLEPAAWLELRARLERADRDAGPYSQPGDDGLSEHPLMRKFHLADRDRKHLQIDLNVFPLPELTLGASYRYSDDRYSQSIIGLQGSDDHALSLDAGWTASDRLYAHAFVSHDEIASSLTGAESAAAALWVATTEDRFLTAGLGILLDLHRRLRLGLDLVYARSEGEIRTVTESGGGPFSTLDTELTNARIHLEYEVNAHWGIKGSLEFESYDSTDWALDGLGPDGIPSILTFGAESPDYGVTVLRVQASYRL
jgi:MtrB/PioB family decaheme-associated outer membrane protein